MELFDIIRKSKRLTDGCMSTRRAFLTVAVVFGLLLYLGPSVFRWLRQKTPIIIDSNVSCISQRLDQLYRESLHFDATVSYSYNTEPGFLPYVGNGVLGLSLKGDSPIYIVRKRSLSMAIPFHPIIFPELPGAQSQEGTGAHFTTGMGYKFKCFNQRHNTVETRQEIFADRNMPSILVQTLLVKNPLNEAQTVTLSQTRAVKAFILKDKTFLSSNGKEFYISYLKFPDGKKWIIAVVGSSWVPETLTVDPKSLKSLTFLTSIHYAETSSSESKILQGLEKNVEKDINMAIALGSNMRNNHAQVWRQLWTTGFSISRSMAENSINGDRINATLYYALSNARTYLEEEGFPANEKRELQALLAYPDQCYDGLHTIQAQTLWSHLTTIEDVNKIVALWMLTLEKQGCQKLLRAGAEGVMLAMVLSFGALRFSNHHLEFDMHPKELHRDYHFRRISYGNSTHVNISVVVGVDNKAQLQVALDRSNRDYYGCDGGCLDPPVKLGSEVSLFPVKLTEPVTAVLYITSDREHMEELKHTIHVKEVQEAPAHEHHVLALHRHGHKLGGLPALFWVSIAFLIVVFHLFLAKLIYNEYCTPAQKNRGRYVV